MSPSIPTPGCTIFFTGSDQSINVAEPLTQVKGELNDGIGAAVVLHQHGDPSAELLVVKANVTYVKPHRA